MSRGEKVYVITSGKGGVGKTTVTAGLGAALASFGSRVALVDADTGLRNLDVSLGLENRVVYDSVDVARGKCSLRQVLVKDKKLGNLYLLPAAQRADKLDLKAEDLRKICRELRDMFDFVFIDSPAGIEHGFRTAASAAERAIVVTTPDIAAVRDADRVVGLLMEMGLTDPLLIVNRARPKLACSGDSLSVDDVVDLLRIELLGAIPEDDRTVACANKGIPITLDPLSPAGRALRAVALRLTGELNTPIALPEEVGLLKRLARALGLEV